MSEDVPAYLKIRQYVFAHITNVKADGSSLKINTEEELCNIFSVSRKTVRKAMGEMVKEGLLVRRARLGTFIRPEVVNSLNMQFGKNLAIGLIYMSGMLTFLTDSFMIQTETVFKILRENGCFARLIFLNDNPEHEAEQLSNSKLDGIVWVGPEEKHIPMLRLFKSFNVPVVCTLPEFAGDEFDFVNVDYYKQGYMVANHLLNRGHRKILCINRCNGESEAQKKAGWKAALAEHGVKWNDNLWHCISESYIFQIQNIIDNAGDFTAINCHENYINAIKQEMANRLTVEIIHDIWDKSTSAVKGTTGIFMPVKQASSIATTMLLEKINHPGKYDKVRQIYLESEIFEPVKTKNNSKIEFQIA